MLMYSQHMLLLVITMHNTREHAHTEGLQSLTQAAYNGIVGRLHVLFM